MIQTMRLITDITNCYCILQMANFRQMTLLQQSFQSAARRQTRLGICLMQEKEVEQYLLVLRNEQYLED